MDCEVLFLVYALKLAMPNYVFVNRGNHELRRMNEKYGYRYPTLGFTLTLTLSLTLALPLPFHFPLLLTLTIPQTCACPLNLALTLTLP